MTDTIFDVPLKDWGSYQYLEFIITYVIPIIGSFAIIVGGIWMVYKYFNEKNRAFYLEILEKVYSPLFIELIKNEYSRKIIQDSDEDEKTKKEYRVKELPFITWSSVRTNTKMTAGRTEIHQEEFDVFDIDIKLREICDDSERLKYAPKDLVALIESYFFLENVKGDPMYESEKVRIQRHIRRNIIIGYKKYRKRLGLKDVSHIKFSSSVMGWVKFW